MTRDDYAEAGVPSPHCPSCGGLPPCRCELNQIRGCDFTFISMDEFPAHYADVLKYDRDEWAKRYECEWPSDRCNNCGDETGECGCAA